MTRETNLSLRSTLRLKRSLGGYSHQERWHAPDKTHSARIRRTRGQLSFAKGLEDNSRLQKDSNTALICKGLEDRFHYKDSSTVRITRTQRPFSVEKTRVHWIEGSSDYSKSILITWRTNLVTKMKQPTRLQHQSPKEL